MAMLDCLCCDGPSKINDSSSVYEAGLACILIVCLWVFLFITALVINKGGQQFSAVVLISKWSFGGNSLHWDGGL